MSIKVKLDTINLLFCDPYDGNFVHRIILLFEQVNLDIVKI